MCKRAHLLTVCDEDAAGRWYTYRTVTIKKPFRLAIKPFWKQVRELNDKIPNLPCQSTVVERHLELSNGRNSGQHKYDWA